MTKTPNNHRNARMRILSSVLLIAFILPVFAFLFVPMPAEAQLGAIIGLQVDDILSDMFGAVLTIEGKFLALIVAFLDGAIRWGVDTPPDVVKRSWGLVRDFANMFFIVILIVMAFATIFDVGSFGFGGYDVGSLIARFLIVALLINFSLVIAIQLSSYINLVNSAFLRSINANNTNLSSRLANGLTPAVGIGNEGTTQTDLVKQTECSTWLYVGNAIGITNSPVCTHVSKVDPGTKRLDLFPMMLTIFMMLIVIVSLLVPLIFVIVRIPMLWFLFIMAPLAWLCSILPATRSISHTWWKQFWAWNLFLPIFLFFLYLGMAFLNPASQRTVFDAISPVAVAGAPGENFAQMMFFYILIGIIMISGTAVAFTSSMTAGIAATGAGRMAMGAVRGVTVGSMSRGAYRRSGAQGAVKEKTTQIRKEGLFGRFGGERQLKEREAKFGMALGVRGAELTKHKQYGDIVQKELADLRKRDQEGLIDRKELKQDAEAGKATNAKTMARRMLLAELGDSSGSMILKSNNEIDNPLVLNALAASLKKGGGQKLTAKEKLELSAGEGDYANMGQKALGLRRAVGSTVPDNRKAIVEMNVNQLGTITDILGGDKSPEGMKFRKQVSKLRPDLLVEEEMTKDGLLEKSMSSEESTEKINNMYAEYEKLKGTYDKDMELARAEYEGDKSDENKKHMEELENNFTKTAQYQQFTKVQRIFRSSMSDATPQELASMHATKVWKDKVARDVLTSRFARKEDREMERFYGQVQDQIEGAAVIGPEEQGAAERNEKTKLAKEFYENARELKDQRKSELEARKKSKKPQEKKREPAGFNR